MTKTLTIRLSAEDLESLEELARSTKRSKAFLASQAVSEYVTSQQWQIGALDEAHAQVSRGEVVSAGAVKDWLRTWGTGSRPAAPHSSRRAQSKSQG